MPELDLEERLRETVTRQSRAYNPSPDLPTVIHARVRGRRHRRTTVLGAVAAGVLVAGGLGAVLVVGADEPDTEMAPADRSTTTTATTVPETTTTATATPTTTVEAPTTTVGTTVPETAPDTATTTTTRPRGPIEPSSVPITDGTPLDRAGIGPIEGGMTLRQVQEAGILLTIDEPLGSNTTCVTAGLEGTRLWLLLEFSGGEGADPLDAVVLSVQGATSTVDGVAVGQTRDQVRAAYGEPTEVRDDVYRPGGTIEVFAEGGVAYGAALDGAGVVTYLESGLVEGIGTRQCGA